jgi:hypothetical protein
MAAVKRNHPVEKQEKKGGVDQAAEQEPSAPDTPQEIKAMSDKKR